MVNRLRRDPLKVEWLVRPQLGSPSDRSPSEEGLSFTPKKKANPKAGITFVWSRADAEPKRYPVARIMTRRVF